MTLKNDYMWEKEEQDVVRVFETASERFRRRLSLVVINIVCFISTMGFSIVLTGAYPYLLQLDELADKKFLGWAIAANPVGQMISSPIVGWLGNRLNSVRWLCMGTGFLNLIGFTLYACLGALPQPRRYWMIVARLIVGIAAGSVALCITYISKATTTEERTTFIAINAFASTIGFIIGPVIQTAFITLGQDGIYMGIADLRLNMYSAAGWFAACMSIISITLFLPGIFHEYNMAEQEAQWKKMRQAQKQDIDATDLPITGRQKKDLIGVLICIFNFSVAGFVLIMIETLATPIVMDQLGYSDEEAIKKVGIVLSGGSVMTALSFASSGPLAKKITERKALLFMGLFPLLISHIILLPYSGPLPTMQNPASTPNMTDLLLDGVNMTEVETLTINMNGTRHSGCPIIQEWCKYTPAVHAEQLVIGFVFIAVGYAFTCTMSTSTMTQVLGPVHQGTWNGIYQAGGSFSRIMGPVFLTTVYTYYGTWATFGSVITLLIITISLNIYFFRHLIPLKKRGKKRKEISF